MISVIDPEEIVMYLETGLEAKQVDEDGPHRALEVAGGFGGRLELVHEPNLRPDVALHRGCAASLGVGRRRPGQSDGA